MRKVVLHVGAPKSGSTVIQQSLNDEKDLLKSSGWIYKTNPRTISNTTLFRNLVTDKDTFLNKLNAHFSGVGSEDVILSSEFFFFLSESLLKVLRQAVADVFATDKILLIAYIRPQDEYLESQLRQNAKNLSYRSDLDILRFEEWLNNNPGRYLDYYGHFEMFERVMGIGHVIPRLFSRDHFFGGSLLSDLCHTADLPRIKQHENRIANPSLSAHEALFLSGILNNAIEDVPEQHNKPWHMRKKRNQPLGLEYANILSPIIQGRLSADGDLLDTATRKAIRKRFRRSNIAFCKKWDLDAVKWFTGKPKSTRRARLEDIPRRDLLAVIAELTGNIARLDNQRA